VQKFKKNSSAKGLKFDSLVCCCKVQLSDTITGVVCSYCLQLHHVEQENAESISVVIMHN
jgi:hypothetical protein